MNDKRNFKKYIAEKKKNKKKFLIPWRPFMASTDPFKNLIIEEIRQHVTAIN